MTEKEYCESLKNVEKKKENGISSYKKINEAFADFIAKNNCKRKGGQNEGW